MNHFKKKLTAFTAMLAFVSLSSAASYAGGIDTSANNVLGRTGNVGFVDTSSTRTDVNITDGIAGSVGQVDWKDFSIAAGKHVNFGFSGLSQTIINRVLGGKTSEIMGRMTSSCIGSGNCSAFNETSKVLLINPAGVLFGEGSKVDLNSLTTSTFDMKGAQNLSGLSGSKLVDYTNDVLNKASAYHNQVVVNGVAYNEGSVELDSNYTEAFEKAGISNPDQMIQGSKIELNKATFSHWARDSKNDFDFDNELAASPNKSLAFVSNNIDYKDSILRTGLNYNYIGRSGDTVDPSSFSNVKLVTADGVTFNYAVNGYVDSHQVAQTDNHPDLARSITMDNGNLINEDPSKAAIIAGDIAIEQRSQVGSNPGVNIKDTIVKGYKLVNRENGNIEIVASDDIVVDHSRLETDNTSAKYAGVTKDTYSNYGGEIYIKGDKNVTVDDSTLISSGSTGNAAYLANNGAIRVLAKGGDANVTDSMILADGNAQVKASNEVNIDNSMVQAYNTIDKTVPKDVTIVGEKGVNINNTDSNAIGSIIVLAGNEATGKLTGDINITNNGTKSIANNDPNKPVMEAGDSISIQGKNTTIDNVTLAYKGSDNLIFYDSEKSGSDYVNNVTIKNDTAFTPYNVDPSTGNKSLADDINIKTNGDITFDNANVEQSEYYIHFDRTDGVDHGYDLASTNPLNDDGTIDAISYQTHPNPQHGDAVNVNIESTQGSVTVTNASDIDARNDITVKAAKNYTQNGESKLIAGNDTSVTAGKDVAISSNSLVQGGDDATVTSTAGNVSVDNSKVYAIVNDASVNAKAGTITLANNTQVVAGNDATVNGDKGVTVDNATVVAGSDSTGFDKTKDANDTIGDANIIANNGDVSITNSYVASEDKDVNVTAGGDVTVEDSTVVAQNDATVTSKAGDITVDDSDVVAYVNDASLNANAGEVTLKDNTRVQAGNDVNVNGNKGVAINDSTVVAGSDTVGFDVVKDSQDKIGDVNITADDGNVSIDSSTVQSQDNDVNVTAGGNVDLTESSVVAVEDTNITAGADYTQDDTVINSLAGNTTVQAGDEATVKNKSNIISGNDTTVQAKNDVTVTGQSIIAAGSDKEGFDGVHDSQDNIGDANVISQNGNVTIDNSNVKSDDHDVNVTAGKDVTLADSRIDAVNDTNVTAGDDYTQDHSNINSYTGDTTVVAGGSATLEDGSLIESGNDSTVDAQDDVTIDNSAVIAGSDKEGFDKVNDPNDTIGDANITSQNGSVNIVNNSTVESEDNDVNIASKDDIKFGPKDGDNVNIDKTANIKAEDDVNITSTDGNIEGEKTTMPTIKYGDELTFTAGKSNIFTSEDSLKSVNVNYVAGESNQLYTNGDIQFVDSTLEAPNNFIEAGGDVILNNLEVKPATDDPADTVTQIFANGDVTTYNVTGEDLTNQKDPDGYYSYPKEVSTQRVERGENETLADYIDGLESTPLDINETKLQVVTDTKKNDSDPDNGSITLVLQNADNPDAGIELEARNVDELDKDPDGGYFKPGYYKTGDPQWDGNSEDQEGPEVHIDREDNTEDIAVSKIVTDKLFVDDDTMDHLISAPVTNLSDTELSHVIQKHDPSGYIEVKDYKGFNQDTDFTKDDPDNFDYTANEHPIEVPGGNTIYPDHTIVNDNPNSGDFNLVYDRPSNDCPPLPPIVRPDPTPSTDDVSLLTIPRETSEISKTSTVSDNTADQTSNIMAAASKVQLSESIDASYDDNDNNKNEDDDLE